MKASDHLFFTLSAFQDLLEEWVSGEQLQASIANKLREWIDAGLQDWDISRDAPYFGFEIMVTPKYFVWLDAPIGYIASHQNLCEHTDDDFELWQPGNDTELYHFIGKDIINFHNLFWLRCWPVLDYDSPPQFSPTVSLRWTAQRCESRYVHHGLNLS